MTSLREADEVGSRALGSVPQLRGTIRLPSDKSIAHRALMLNAIASGDATVTLRHPGDDVLSTVSALRSVGARIEGDPNGSAEVDLDIQGLGDDGVLGTLRSGDADCGNSGTTMRLLSGLAAFADGPIRLTGDASLSRRPMERIAEPLRLMGAGVDTTDGHAPITLHPTRPLRAIEYKLPVASAQVLGAILFAGLGSDAGVRVTLPTPVRDHSQGLLAAMGVAIDASGLFIHMDSPGSLAPVSMSVPGDISSAAAWLVAGAIHPDAEIHLEGVGLNPTRTAIIDALQDMGADIRVHPTGAEGGEPVGDITVRGGRALNAIDIGPDRVPALIDELPILAVAMASATGTSEVRGAPELRVKESDRIAAMAVALHTAGTHIEELPDGWRIRRGRPADAHVTTHGDHRIAIAMAIAAMTGVTGTITLDDPGCVAVSYPTFWRNASDLGALA